MLVLLKAWLFKALVPVIFGYIVVSILWITAAENRLTSLKSALDSEKAIVKNERTLVKRNADSLEHCLHKNALNREAAIVQIDKAKLLLNQIVVLEEEIVQTRRRLNNASNELRGKDTEKRTLDDPLPNWFVDGMHKSKDS